MKHAAREIARRAVDAPGRAARAGQAALEAQRLEQRTLYDLEMLRGGRATAAASRTTSRHLVGAQARASVRARCSTIFPQDFLCVVDEIARDASRRCGGMYHGDRARKMTLVEYGFRLPSALDNRPLKFDEWTSDSSARHLRASATPADYELREGGGEVASRSIRPDRAGRSRDRGAAGRADRSTTC